MELYPVAGAVGDIVLEGAKLGFILVEEASGGRGIGRRGRKKSSRAAFRASGGSWQNRAAGSPLQQ